jgi:hypothetical protein
MDYKRIYEELIEHRKMLPKLEGVYYERHHIVPRCMGGGDEDENLIYLTAEDHFMAHALLAHAYNTPSLWWAVLSMKMNSKRLNRVIRNRRMFGIARRKAGGSSRLKDEVRTWVRISDGAKFELTRKELMEKFEIPLKKTSALLSGITKRALGFTVEGVDPLYESRDNKVYHIVNVDTKEEYHYTREQMRSILGMSVTQSCDIATKKQAICKGFCLYSVFYGLDEESLKIQPDRLAKHMYYHVSTGETLYLTKPEILSQFGFSRTTLSRLHAKKKEIVKGFKLLEEGPVFDPSNEHRITLHPSKV